MATAAVNMRALRQVKEGSVARASAVAGRASKGAAESVPRLIPQRHAQAGKAVAPAVLPFAARRVLRESRGAFVVAAAESRPWAQCDCRLVLEDGSEFLGYSFGAEGTQLAEVVFNTAITGYQEILTDPSYKGQAVTFTHPHIGNTGINFEDMESETVHLSGIIVRDLAAKVSNYRAKVSLSEYLKEQGVMGISGVDTREITRRLRNTGCLNGIITTDMTSATADLVAKTKEWSILGKDLISEVTCTKPYEWNELTDEEWETGLVLKAKKARADGSKPFKIVAYDFGIKSNILRRLASFGCYITVVPANTPAEEVLAMNPDGIFFSNGPGDPSAVPYAVENAKKLLGTKPIFGICMGHQVLGQAFGGTTFKLPFGHHGGNHPIRHMPSGRIEISSQNHNYAVDPATLPKDVEVTHINLNDGTCAGMLSTAKNALSIQYHPEASPGPHDADVCFEMFVDMMKAARKGAAV